MQIWFSKLLFLQEKIAKSSSQDEVKLYDTQAQDALKKSVFELQLDIIQNSDKSAENDLSCYHKFDCLNNN